MEKKNVALPRGIRNCNPLNLVYNKKNNWHGQLPLNKIIEPRFCRFSNMMWGFRAAACLLRKYIRVYTCNSIRLIIAKWAPSNENNTDAYIKNVADIVGINCDTEIKFDDTIVMLRLISAMCVVENGKEYDPQKNNELWSALYKGYMMARENTTDFLNIEDNYCKNFLPIKEGEQ